MPTITTNYTQLRRLLPALRIFIYIISYLPL